MAKNYNARTKKRKSDFKILFRGRNIKPSPVVGHRGRKANNIVLVNLCIGSLGNDRARVLGSIIINAIASNLYARAPIDILNRKKLFLIADEFGLYDANAIATIITGLSKFQVNMAVAHQHFEQLAPELGEVIKLAGTRVFFKLSRRDCELVCKELHGGVTAEDIANLRQFNAFALIKDRTYKIEIARPVTSENDFSEEIMKENLKKYYLPLNIPEQQEKLLFDTL